MHEVIDKHQRIALQFSGGKDSLACLHLMKPYWDKLTVYWCNSGDPYPETVRLMKWVKNTVPNFVEIQGRQPEAVSMFGLPTDILPVSGTYFGVMNGGQKLQDSYSCCYRSLMLPLHQRMLDDGITLIVRGQKNLDRHKGTLRSGSVEDGIEYLYPIEQWSDRQVMQFLQENEIDIPRFYDMGDNAHDCMGCTGWWSNNSLAYLKRYHPDHYYSVQRKLDEIMVSVQPYIQQFNSVVSS